MKYKAYELNGQWRWVLYDDNGEILCVSPTGYGSKFECLSVINRVKSSSNAVVEGFR